MSTNDSESQVFTDKHALIFQDMEDIRSINFVLGQVSNRQVT
jgi:hypothetical protein